MPCHRRHSQGIDHQWLGSFVLLAWFILTLGMYISKVESFRSFLAILILQEGWTGRMSGDHSCRGVCKSVVVRTKLLIAFSCFACCELFTIVCCAQYVFKSGSQWLKNGFCNTWGFGQNGKSQVTISDLVPGRYSKVPFWWFCLLACCRIGEARVPGPSNWAVAVCNPAGLMHKGHLFPLEEANVWLVSETHLTSSGVRTFKKTLQRELQEAWLVPGHPVSQRSTVSDHGAWSGVGVVASCPCQALPHDWLPLAFESSRLQAFTAFCNNIWLNGVVVYGLPTGPTHPKATSRTNSLLQEAIRRVLCMDGPRVLGGDFNHDIDELSALEVLYAHHWIEIQDLLHLQQGVAPRPTCKMKTRRDFLFISPELIPLFRGATVEYSHWIDHASLIAHFQGDASDLVRTPWPIPRPIPWEQLQSVPPGAPCSMDFENGCDQVYRQFWAQVEQHWVDETGGSAVRLSSNSLGRAFRRKPLKVVGTVKPIAKGRKGEVVPQFFGISFWHKHWFRQLRRLQSYVRLAKVATLAPSHVEHRASLWHAILNAPGFQPNFSDWWEHRDLKEGFEPAIPLDPPTFDFAKFCFEAFEKEVREVEAHLKTQHRGHAAHTKEQAMAQLYKSVKDEAPVQVDALVSSRQAIIETVDPVSVTVDCAIELDRAVEWDETKPIHVAGVPLETNMITSDKIYLSSSQEVHPGQTVTQNLSCGKLDVIFETFIEHWSKLWVRHSKVPRSQWDTILDFARAKLGFRKLPPLDLCLPLLSATAKSKKKTAAVGLDGVRRSDILGLSSNQMVGLQHIYQHAHTNWPQQTVEGVVKSLAKVVRPTSVSEFRPITVFSFTYRLWSSAQSRYWLQQLEPYLDRMLHGSRAGHQAAMLWRQVMEEVEWAYLQGGELCGIIIDLCKAYNTLPRLPCLALSLMVGVDPTVVTAWTGALTQMSRRFWVRGSVSRPVFADRGFPEGCGLSCMSMLLLDELWHLWVRQSNQFAQPMSYVDNWEILNYDVASLTATWNATLKFADLLDLQIDVNKTCTWATSPALRVALRSGGFTVIHDGKDLGAHVVYSRQIRNSSQLKRFRSLNEFWKRLRKAIGSFAQKTRVIRTAGWPKALHGISANIVGRKHFHSLRSCVVQALDLQKPGLNPHVLCHLIGQLDPQFVALIDTIRSWRQVGNRAHQMAMLQSNGSLGIGVPMSSLTSVLEQRLHVIGWHFQAEGMVVGNDVPNGIDLATHNWRELVWLLERAWHNVVASQVAHRECFCHFEKTMFCTPDRLLVLSILLNKAF